jgi:hypothetical protein
MHTAPEFRGAHIIGSFRLLSASARALAPLVAVRNLAPDRIAAGG